MSYSKLGGVGPCGPTFGTVRAHTHRTAYTSPRGFGVRFVPLIYLTSVSPPHKPRHPSSSSQGKIEALALDGLGLGLTNQDGSQRNRGKACLLSHGRFCSSLLCLPPSQILSLHLEPVGLSLIIFLKLPASSHLQIPLTQGHQEARSSLLKIWAKNSREE